MIITKKKICWIYLLFLLLGCEQNLKNRNDKEVIISGRENEEALYHLSVPISWTVTQEIKEKNLDTRIPICTFTIDDVVIHLHNFPVQSLETRIAPQAQIARWQKQFEVEDSEVTSIAGSGFSGLRLEAYGIKEGKSHGVLGYSLQMTPKLFQMLKSTELEKGSDVTIKATGPKASLERLRSDLDSAFESFELIYPISFSK